MPGRSASNGEKVMEPHMVHMELNHMRKEQGQSQGGVHPPLFQYFQIRSYLNQWKGRKTRPAKEFRKNKKVVPSSNSNEGILKTLNKILKELNKVNVRHINVSRWPNNFGEDILESA